MCDHSWRPLSSWALAWSCCTSGQRIEPSNQKFFNPERESIHANDLENPRETGRNGAKDVQSPDSQGLLLLMSSGPGSLGLSQVLKRPGHPRRMSWTGHPGADPARPSFSPDRYPPFLVNYNRYRPCHHAGPGISSGGVPAGTTPYCGVPLGGILPFPPGIMPSCGVPLGGILPIPSGIVPSCGVPLGIIPSCLPRAIVPSGCVPLGIIPPGRVSFATVPALWTIAFDDAAGFAETVFPAAGVDVVVHPEMRQPRTAPAASRNQSA
jgi:hypothetical protein